MRLVLPLPLAVQLLAALLLAAPEPPLAARERPHVLLVSVDTLRADALSCYGYPEEVTPHLDALAARGVLHIDTLSTIGKTGPAFSSLFTSLYPPTHGARRNGVPMRPDVPTLPELLAGGGYQTAAFISNWTLRRNLAAVDRGFEHFDQEFTRKRNLFGAAERDAPSVVAATLDWLEAGRDRTRPLFLWVHFSEPHDPYDLHRGFEVPKPPGSERAKGWQKRWRYASEVAFTDHMVGELLRSLEPHLPAAETLVVFVADHGESLGEHGYWGHGKNTLWPNLRIPLILSGPGIPENRRVEGPASIVDLLPTLLELLDFERPARIEGISLVPSWSGSPPADRPRYTFADRHTVLGQVAREGFEHPLEISMVSSGVKTVYEFDSRRTRFFDLRTDPLEVEPLESPPLAATPPLYRQLASWYRQLPKYLGGANQLSDEDLEQLKSLGYVGSP
ncbi:MAG TPA: sulfatase [Thermoanaerobaculia bacterium]|nr:sulfatase [Thermoanaerobaculia bacterium]